MKPERENPAPVQQGEAQNITDQPQYNTLPIPGVQSPDAAAPVTCAAKPEEAKSTPASPESHQPPGASIRAIMVSMVSCATDTETRQVVVGEVLDAIRSGVWQQQVEPIRGAYQEAQKKLRDPQFCEIALDEYRRLARKQGAKGDRVEEMAQKALANFGKKRIAALKQALPGVMFSGVFQVRKADALKEPSGLLCADLDTLGDRLTALKEELTRDPHVVAAFISPSGDGLKVLVWIPVEVANFKKAFVSVQAHFRKRHAVEIDRACSDISRMCYASYDPELWCNAGPIPLPLLSDDELKEMEQADKPKSKEKAAHSSAGKKGSDKRQEADDAPKESQELFDLDKDVVRSFLDDHPDDQDASKIVSALEFIDPSDEKTWREIGMALKSRCGDDAWELFDEWSTHGAGYDERENSKRWDTFADDAEGGISLGTVFHHAKQNGWKFRDKKTVVLPTRSNTVFCRAVYRIMGSKHSVFLQGGETACIEVIEGEEKIVLVDAIKGIRLFERHIQFLKEEFEKDENGEPVPKYVPVPLSEHHSKLLVKGVQPGELPELKGITRCAPLIPTSDGKKLEPAGRGYIPESGWFNVSEDDVPIVPLGKAVEHLKWLYREFDFGTPGDMSRAVVYPIGLAIKLSGLIKGFVPLDFGTANAQQSGKGTRQRMTAAFFGHTVEVITQSEAHIGGTAESFKAACLAGKPFIQLDNFDHYSCREMEAFLTGERVMMRAAFGRSRSVDPANYFVCISSNGLAARKDLAERAWFIRIMKKPDDYQFHPYPEGGIDKHVLKNRNYYLGCLYTVIQEWWARGQQRTDETRHSFREFTQVCDWIAQHILCLAPVMDGHKEAAALYGDAGKVFFSRVWDTAEKQGRLNQLFKATQLALMAFRFSIPVPGAIGRALKDEQAAAKLIGGVAADLFRESNHLDLGEGRIVERQSGRPFMDDSDLDDDDRFILPRKRTTHCYVLKKISEVTSEGGQSEGHTNQGEQPPLDGLVRFRDDLLARMTDDGKPLPRTISTSEISELFDDCTPDTAGRWMAQLVERWPRQFIRVRRASFRGWKILPNTALG